MLKPISSVEHSLVKHLAKLRINKDYREDHHSVVMMGIKPVTELLATQKAKVIFASDESLIPKKAMFQEAYIVNEAILKKVTGMQSPEGLVAEFSIPQQADLKGIKRVLVLDGINDPGNMGTLLRTALALDWEGVFIIDNSCDPYNDKALRAARGATFKLPLRQGTWKELKAIVERESLKPFVADLKGTSPEKVATNHSLLLVLSNEAQGVSKEANKFCEKVSIPMNDQVESLNVAIAGGILMYFLRKSP